jgi:hypothetical protein
MTIEQLAIKVLSKIGKYEQGSLAAADFQNVQDAYASLYLTLADDGLVTWAFADTDIPNRFILPLTTLLAAEIADFYHSPAPAEGWYKTKIIATNQIRHQLSSGQDPEPVTAEYF